MRFDITLDGVDATLANLDLADRCIERGAVSFLNKIGAQAVTASVRAITRSYNVKTRDVKQGMRLIRARASSRRREGRLYSTVTASGPGIPLFRFGGRPTSPVSQRGIPKHPEGRVRRARGAYQGAPYPSRKRASVLVRKGGRRAVLHHAFVARMPSGHVGIFERVGKRSLPIRELYSLNVPTMFKLRAVDEIRRLMREKGPAMLRHEIAWQLRRFSMRRTA